jgi:2-hydroxy-3-keto-5-methylthiopentenyl-1-phosphate phosphatase
MRGPLRRPTLFLDFDGTVSRCDVVDAILTEYAGPAWLEVERQWQAGAIGSRECLRQQMGLVRASREQMDSLLDAVEVDEGFVPLLEMCGRRGIPVHIVSDGFDYCIRRILRRTGPDAAHLLRGLHIYASHLAPSEADRWVVDFSFPATVCEHGCATCKPWAMRQLNPNRRPAIFVGDGLSDRYAVRSGAVVFAKTGLATFCEDQNIPHHRYGSLRHVAAQIDDMMSAAQRQSWRTALHERYGHINE